MTLTAPPHLRGSLLNQPKERREAVYAWVVEQWIEGHMQKDIAEALGIRRETVSEILARLKVRRPFRPLTRSTVTRTGLRFGSMTCALGTMTPNMQHQLLDDAAHSGRDLAEEMAAFYARHRRSGK